MNNTSKNSKLVNKENFAKKLKVALKNNKLEHKTYKELGKFFGTTDMAVHNWLSAKSMPSMSRLPSIAEKLSVSIDYLLYDFESKEHTDNEKILLNNYRKLSKKQQDAVDVILLGLV
jgi:transcriptional regulator with XRE-family HTH domain